MILKIILLKFTIILQVNKYYYDKAIQRIKNHVAQQTLF